MGLFTERDEETPNQIILGKLNRIEAKLDAVIKAMHDYDGNDEYGESSFEAFQLTNDYISSLGGPCVGHDKASWDEEEAERRMNIIGQNGNEGSHYVTNEEADEDAKFSDYGQRIAKEVMSNENNIRVGKDKSNNSAKPISEFEKRNGVSNPLVEGKNKNKQYYKNKRSKRSENKK